MGRSLSVVVFCCLLAASQPNAEIAPTATEKYESPDHTAIALVISKKIPTATRESRVEVWSESGRLIATTSYFSPDGEHGFGVNKALWTPDSQFFVYSLESSGGHQAWHTPVRFFDRKRKQTVSLDAALNDPIMDPNFIVREPDHVTVQLWSSKKQVTVSLSTLHSSR